MLCCGYYGLIYCANRKHKVSYETAEKKKSRNKMHESEMQQIAANPDRTEVMESRLGSHPDDEEVADKPESFN